MSKIQFITHPFYWNKFMHFWFLAAEEGSPKGKNLSFRNMQDLIVAIIGLFPEGSEIDAFNLLEGNCSLQLCTKHHFYLAHAVFLLDFFSIISYTVGKICRKGSMFLKTWGIANILLLEQILLCWNIGKISKLFTSRRKCSPFCKAFISLLEDQASSILNTLAVFKKGGKVYYTFAVSCSSGCNKASLMSNNVLHPDLLMSLSMCRTESPSFRNTAHKVLLVARLYPKGKEIRVCVLS